MVMLLASGSLLADFGPLVAKSALVLALVALAAWAAARFLGPRLAARRGNARMRVIERLALEPRRNLYLVDVDGEILVVGVSEHGVAFHKPSAAHTPAAGPEEAQ